MSKMIFRTAVLVSLVFIFGCWEQEQLKDDDRFKVNLEETETAGYKKVVVSGASEVGLVEKMADRRTAYRESLEELKDFYIAAGNAAKLRWARREIEALVRMPKYRYLMPAESAHVGLQATDSIIEADELYAEALRIYKEAVGLAIIVDENKLRTALNMFNKLIADYPKSDKIDDSAYRAGRIYEHFKDYEIAAVYYQRAFEWSESTPYPARFRAARLLDKHLHMGQEALTLYQLAIEKESRDNANAEYAERRIAQLTRPLNEPEVEEDIED